MHVSDAVVVDDNDDDVWHDLSFALYFRPSRLASRDTRMRC
jgi:hypothetical protein